MGQFFFQKRYEKKNNGFIKNSHFPIFMTYGLGEKILNSIKSVGNKKFIH